MGASGNGLMTYVTILDRCEDGTVWLQVQLPTGPLARGPYGTIEQARGAAAALERVARRRWARHEPGTGLAGALIGDHAPMPPVTAGRGEESAEEPPIRPGISQIHRILARFRPTST